MIVYVTGREKNCWFPQVQLQRSEIYLIFKFLFFLSGTQFFLRKIQEANRTEPRLKAHWALTIVRRRPLWAREWPRHSRGFTWRSRKGCSSKRWYSPLNLFICCSLSLSSRLRGLEVLEVLRHLEEKARPPPPHNPHTPSLSLQVLHLFIKF